MDAQKTNNVLDAHMGLNNAGQMIETDWLKLPQRFKNIKLHEYIIMLNHFHEILEIVGATLVVAQKNAPVAHIANHHPKNQVRISVFIKKIKICL